jgi:hypothetical protein
MEGEEPDISQAGIYLDQDTKKRVESFLQTVDGLLWEVLLPELRTIYDGLRVIRMFTDYGMTIPGYVEFLNACHDLVKLTDLPFSLDEEFGGLKNWDDWNSAIETATEKARKRFKQ